MDIVRNVSVRETINQPPVAVDPYAHSHRHHRPDCQPPTLPSPPVQPPYHVATDAADEMATGDLDHRLHVHRNSLPHIDFKAGDFGALASKATGMQPEQTVADDELLDDGLDGYAAVAPISGRLEIRVVPKVTADQAEAAAQTATETATMYYDASASGGLATAATSTSCSSATAAAAVTAANRLNGNEEADVEPAPQLADRATAAVAAMASSTTVQLIVDGEMPDVPPLPQQAGAPVARLAGDKETSPPPPPSTTTTHGQSKIPVFTSGSARILKCASWAGGEAQLKQQQIMLIQQQQQQMQQQAAMPEMQDLTPGERTIWR